METLHISFKELFDKDITRIGKVVIPKIQRAYAQGRTDSRTERTRRNFLNAIYTAVAGGNQRKEGLTLDFIYGKDDGGTLIPLDGQQRLTTLFLLHWYAAKKGKVADDCLAFLYNFSYETRYSAREFCNCLIAFTPSFEGKISAEIEDQPWFPLDWKHDATVASMLVMLDAIDERFCNVPDLWRALDSIKFHFLPIGNMGLTDDIYIKMNSRGKPLTEFEHFKAEFEKAIKAVDPVIADEIGRKIDTVWTDMLWPYRGENNIIDDEFLRFFRFVCDIICYKGNGSPKHIDEFELLEVFFKSDGTEESVKTVRENLNTLERYFNCWNMKADEVDALFKRFISVQHEPGKIRLFHNYRINIFADCLNDYADVLGNKNRKFPLNKIILLYAFTVYLQNRAKVTESQFARRLRVVYNLIQNSGDEITDSENRVGGNRMPAILRQVDSVILEGVVSDNIVIGGEFGKINFNAYQLKEEQEKLLFTQENPQMEEALFALEDHPLLQGQIGIVGLERPERFGRFAELFDCEWDNVDCALLATGDYFQRYRGWRLQLGSSLIAEAWITLFHQSNNLKGFEMTRECLRKLLDMEKLTDSVLLEIKKRYLASCKEASVYPWQYYYIKYQSFRIGRYGRYVQDESRPYELSTIYAPLQPSNNSAQVFLNEIGEVDKVWNGCCITINDDGDYIRCENDAYTIRNNDDELIEKPIRISQNNDGIDTVDRIKFGRRRLKKYLKDYADNI